MLTTKQVKNWAIFFNLFSAKHKKTLLSRVSNNDNIIKMLVDLSVVYVYFNTPKEILKSLESISEAVGNFSYETIIINNASKLVVPNLANINKRAKIVNNNVNVGYGAALNQGSKLAHGKYLLLANPDTIFLKNSIKLLIDKLERNNKIGIVGPKFISSENKVEITGNGIPTIFNSIFAFTFLNKIFPRNWFSQTYFLTDFDRNHEAEIPVICGACLLIKKELFFKLKGMDERFFMYFEESDLCFRVKKEGYKVLYYPKSKIIHFGGRSSSNTTWIKKTFQDSRYKFFKKYNNIILATLGEFLIRLLNLV